MADLMTQSFSYASLSKTYDGFAAPLLQVTVNGTELVTKLNMPVDSVQIKLSLSAANMAILKIGPIYDEESHSFSKEIKGKFSLGTVVELAVGYQSSAEKVFKGYVAMLGAEFGPRHYLVVTLMDARRLMMKSGSRQVLHDVKNYSDAVSTILKDYTSLGKAVVDATSDKLEHPVSQSQNDYRFITQELIASGKVDREFFVFADKIYFRKPRGTTSPVLSLKPEEALLSLAVQEEYENLQVEVIGYDPKKQTALTAKKPVSAGKNLKKLGGATPTLTLTDAEADTQEKVNARAKTLAQTKGWQKQTGSGTTLGMPQIVPGRYLEIKDLEPDYGDHKYYITDVTHEMNGTHFLTQFAFEGWL